MDNEKLRKAYEHLVSDIENTTKILRDIDEGLDNAKHLTPERKAEILAIVAKCKDEIAEIKTKMEELRKLEEEVEE